MIKELDAGILPLTQDLIIVEASGTELQILGSAVIFLEVDVLGSSKKQMEMAVIKGQDNNNIDNGQPEVDETLGHCA